MNDRMLVEAMVSGDPGAMNALYDAHAHRLYAYCWFLVRSHDIAQVALRDTMVVAHANVAELADPERLGPWLYALARNECRRRDTGTVLKPDVPIATPHQDDADLRVLAWHAVAGLSPASREILELRIRHGLAVPEIADVLDRPAKEIQAHLDQADHWLERAVVAEVLAHRQPYECAERRRILLARQGELTDELRDQLLAHAGACACCAAHRPRNVSAAKVYELLPWPVPPATLRIKVMSCFGDPELAGYRVFAARRAGPLGPDGFPRTSGTSRRSFRRPPVPGTRSWLWRGGETRAVLGLAAGVIAMALAGAGLHWVDDLFGAGARNGSGVHAGAGPGNGGRFSPAGPSPTLPPDADGGDESATFPLGARVPAVPPTALSLTPRLIPPVPPAPRGLPDQPGNDGPASRAARGRSSPPPRQPSGPPTKPSPSGSAPSRPAPTPRPSKPAPAKPTPTPTPKPTPTPTESDPPPSTPPPAPSDEPSPSAAAPGSPGPAFH